MASHIGRRKFLATLGGAAAWPLAARAQQMAMPVIAFISGRSASASTRYVTAFRRGLVERFRIDGLIVLNSRISCIHSSSVGRVRAPPSALSLIDHDLVFVVDQHVPLSL
jgi:hypothetical protein